MIASNYPIVKPAVIKENGKFLVTVELPLPAKVYDVVISALAKGEQQSVENFKVAQQVDEERYIDEALEVTAEQWNEINRLSEEAIISVKGKIVEIIEETDEKNVLLLQLEDDETQKIMIEYHGDTAIEQEAKRQFYGYIMEKDSQTIMVSHVGLRK